MLKNHFKIAWRNLMNNKVFSFINILGLTIGITSCMLITLYIINELSYDKYHVKGNDIYQVGTTFIMQGKETNMPITPAPMARAMQMDFPEIEMTTRLMSLFSEDKTLFQYNDKNKEAKSLYETKGYLADSTFFRMFTYQFIEGNATTALNNPNSIVLSEEIAKKIFGNQQALNKIVHINSSSNGEYDFMVTGVFRPSQHPSHIDARFFMSMKGGNIEHDLKRIGTSFATNNMFYTYLLLRPGSDTRNLTARFPAFIDKYAGKDLKAMGFSKKQFLIALKDIHLRSGMENNVSPPGSMTYLYILASIALFILLIACINFMNLSTAQSSKRSSEVGIRKVLGAEKGSLISKFMGESVFMSLIAFGFAFVIILLLLPAFNSVSGKQLSIIFPDDMFIVSSFLLLAIITGLIAGSYPAFYLSSFKPIKVLKGRFSNSLAAVSLRKGLVVFQFVISVVLIIASVVISKQMNYLRSADLGFEKERQIIIPLRSSIAKNMYSSLKNDLTALSQIESVGASRYNPGASNISDKLFYKEGQTMNDSKRTFTNRIDAGYLKTLKIKLAAGRLFSEEFPGDTNNRIILNECAVKEMGFGSAQNAVNKKVYFDYQETQFAFEIVGVIKDFHFEDLHLPITPYGYELNNASNQFNYMLVHAKPGDVKSLITTIERAWHKLNPNEPFEYSFLDDDFQKNYMAENRLASIVSYFTLIAIIICCLGLFGLATFSAEQRIKEIGVRKVLGASVTSIVTILSKDFLKLVIIAIVIASPIAWYIMNKWLQNFAYRIGIEWWVFVLAGVAATAIAFLTISYQALKTANANPIKSLRTE